MKRSKPNHIKKQAPKFYEVWTNLQSLHVPCSYLCINKLALNRFITTYRGPLLTAFVYIYIYVNRKNRTKIKGCYSNIHVELHNFEVVSQKFCYYLEAMISTHRSKYSFSFSQKIIRMGVTISKTALLPLSQFFLFTTNFAINLVQ